MIKHKFFTRNKLSYSFKILSKMEYNEKTNNHIDDFSQKELNYIPVLSFRTNKNKILNGDIIHLLNLEKKIATNKNDNYPNNNNNIINNNNNKNKSCNLIQNIELNNLIDAKEAIFPYIHSHNKEKNEKINNILTTNNNINKFENKTSFLADVKKIEYKNFNNTVISHKNNDDSINNNLTKINNISGNINNKVNNDNHNLYEDKKHNNNTIFNKFSYKYKFKKNEDIQRKNNIINQSINNVNKMKTIYCPITIINPYFLYSNPKIFSKPNLITSFHKNNSTGIINQHNNNNINHINNKKLKNNSTINISKLNFSKNLNIKNALNNNKINMAKNEFRKNNSNNSIKKEIFNYNELFIKRKRISSLQKIKQKNMIIKEFKSNSSINLTNSQNINKEKYLLKEIFQLIKKEFKNKNIYIKDNSNNSIRINKNKKNIFNKKENINKEKLYIEKLYSKPYH